MEYINHYLQEMWRKYVTYAIKNERYVATTAGTQCNSIIGKELETP